MKILYGCSTYENIRDSKMGGERALWGLARALTERGHEVTITNLLHGAPNWDRGYDIIHLWNCSGQKGPYLLAMQMARMLYKPLFLTPVFWPVDELRTELMLSLELSQKELELQESSFSIYLAGLKMMFADAGWLLPNAEIEMDMVIEHLDGFQCQDGPIEQRYTVIPNGVDVEHEILPSLADDRPFIDAVERKLKKRFVLCVGRVEVRKNQRRLVEAMQEIWKDDPDLQLVLMGAVETKYVSSFSYMLEGANVLLAPEGPPGAVLKLMKRCQAHILVSWMETPGLASLEAAAMGKNVVVCDKGSVREYFGDKAYYCDPLDPLSMAKAIRLAVINPAAPQLTERIRRDYSYTHIAEMAEKAYQEALMIPIRGER